MNFAYFNWAAYGLSVIAVLIVSWAYMMWRYRPPLLARIVAFAHLAVAGFGAAAPLRGLVDPHYAGYRFGYLHPRIGIPTTLVAGGVFIASVMSAYLLMRNPRGSPMWFVTVTSAFFALNFGGSWLEGTLGNFADNTMQFGEYLVIPAFIATPIMFVVFVLPFLAGVSWAPQRART
ncbi:MAG TPA: hypothetical protein VGG69_09690 [Rhizomicrobium sp.]|jgi:hypothetical protein